MNTLTLEKSVLKKIDRKVIIHNEIPIAIVKDNGKIYAFDNRCPHRGGPLYKGSIKKGVKTLAKGVKKGKKLVKDGKKVVKNGQKSENTSTLDKDNIVKYK